ncbi:MAG TPA: ABC transporter ATP-binding protein [Tepidisphaeraceae bacterium]|nr:ABC transporter ATP-binding protein [Tepidisphaeraceae bacterium]
MSPLVVENVSKRFRQGEADVDALAGISLEVAAGQFLAIMGASGSGKSTLLHLMAGLATADAGRVLVNGTDLATLSDKQLTLFRRRNIGLVFQSFNLIPTLTAEENIALPLMLEGKGQREITGKVEEMLRRLGMTARRSHRPDAMSGGEQQRVAIGRALVTDPAVILADEPTGNLDSANSRAVCELLRDLSVIHNKTIVMVTHEPSVAAYAGDVAVVKDGRLVERFATEEAKNGEGVAVRYQDSLRE